jgi:ATP-binding cassette subfamily F protein uup
LAGGNGCGKTTLLRVLLGETAPGAGVVQRAENLRTVYFDQNRDQLDPAWTLKEALAPEGDSVVYRGRVIHVNAWARRFLFEVEQLGQPLGRLSGGERARVAQARLMLREADVLLLDEPTNDLDLPTLGVLEESLADFPGALVLVTHDRYLMDRVCTHVLGFDGQGGTTVYADLAQWIEDLGARKPAAKKTPKEPVAAPSAGAAGAAKKKLSYLEQREYETLEERILEAESALAGKRERMQAPDVVVDGARLAQVWEEVKTLEHEVESLYARWAELEGKLS